MPTRTFIEAIRDTLAEEMRRDESVIVLQSERGSPLEEDAAFADWEHRRYSRNVLLIWQKEGEPEAIPIVSAGGPADE